jgi:hypothetical protein
MRTSAGHPRAAGPSVKLLLDLLAGDQVMTRYAVRVDAEQDPHAVPGTGAANSAGEAPEASHSDSAAWRRSCGRRTSGAPGGPAAVAAAAQAERVPERRGADGLGDACPAGGPADDPPGAVPVQPGSCDGEEDRSLAALADGQVDRPRGPRSQWDDGFLPALADDRQGPVPAFDAQCLDVRAGGLGDPQAVQSQQ